MVKKVLNTLLAKDNGKVLIKSNICLFWLIMDNCYKNVVKSGIEPWHSIKKGFDSEPVDNKRYVGTRMKP